MAARRTSLAGLLLAISLAACGAITPAGGAPDRPDNPRAIEPISIVAQGSGAAGEFRLWAYRTSDGMACIELGSRDGATSACDPRGRPPLDGSGVNRNARGVVAWAATGAATATTAVVHDARGADVIVPLLEGGPSLPGVKLAVASLGTSADPLVIDFLDATQTKVGSVRLR